MTRNACLICVVVAICPLVIFAATGPTITKTEHFDADPSWDGFQNHLVPTSPKQIAQDFDYSATNFAGKAKGEIGGTVWRSSPAASFAATIAPRTLNDRLSASGTFAITASSGSSGAFFGWFKAETPEGGRQNSLGLHFSGEGSGARITLQLVTATNQACGTKITPWIVDRTKPKKSEGRKFRPPLIRNDGTRYTWKLDYDPDAAGGNGQMQFIIRSETEPHDAFEGKTFAVDLPKGYKEQGTTFDRFGLTNSPKPGNSMNIYFDDLQHDGKTEDFSSDAADWSGANNHSDYEQRQAGGMHDFGFSEKSHIAGGAAPGEVGGTIWRSGAYGYYADRIGPLSLTDRLEAGGKVVLTAAPPDSGMYFGWFDSGEKENSPLQAGNFLGVKVGGPTRVGHYFVPAYATALDEKPAPTTNRKEHAPNIAVERGQGPVLVPQKVFDWKLLYDPTANGGNGTIEATLGDQSVTLPLKPGDKAKGATFDRFGLFTTHRGGNYLKIYFDDLAYTSARTPKP